MAWRPTRFLVTGELDNTKEGRVTGWLEFLGGVAVKLDLRGDFHRDIRGANVRLLRVSEPGEECCVSDVQRYLSDFASVQTGYVGDMTAGLPPYDYGQHPYFEWYSKENGRVVVELLPYEVQVVGIPLPWRSTEPIDRAHRDGLFQDFVASISKELGVPVIVARGSTDDSDVH